MPTMQLVRSFDIFETLVVRPFASPHNLFPLVAAMASRKHHISIDSRIFEEGRVLAERTARKRTGKPEVTIDDIYAECRSMLQLSEEDVEILIECEIELE